MRPGFLPERSSAHVNDGEKDRSFHPHPPLAKRLNRNALTVAAIIMGMTVLTAIVLLNPGRDNKTGATPAINDDDTPRVPPRPAFLDEPPPRSSLGSSIAKGADTATTPPLPQASVSVPPPVRGLDAQRTDGDAGVAQESQRERAYHAALSSSVLVNAATPTRPEPNSLASAPSLATEEEQLVTLGDSVLRSALRPGANVNPPTPTPPAQAGESPRSTESQRSFPERAVGALTSTSLAKFEPAGSPYTLRAGTVIPGVLITGINSELPGEIVAQVSRNVYDSRFQRVALIPKGSRLIGTYDNQVAAGQGRLLVAWIRLLLPDGRSTRLPGLPLTDSQGQSGAEGSVDNHWRRVFGNALMLSAIGAGVQLSQPAQASVLSAPSPGQVAAGAVGQELSGVALEILRRGMNVSPTISIPPGQPFNVLLTGDLVFDEPYGQNRELITLARKR
jgi:type IV secretion system protein VirB10